MVQNIMRSLVLNSHLPQIFYVVKINNNHYFLLVKLVLWKNHLESILYKLYKKRELHVKLGFYIQAISKKVIGYETSKIQFCAGKQLRNTELFEEPRTRHRGWKPAISQVSLC